MVFSPRKRRNALQFSFGVEPLETRTLLSHTLKWGPYPKLVGQDVAVSQHPRINGAGEAIVIMDTGINYDDPLLGGGAGRRYKVEAGYDFVNGTNTIPLDPSGHGTNVAGIIGANTFYYDRREYQGIAPGARLIDLRIDDGSSTGPSDAMITQALDWVVAHQARYNIAAVNISEGGDTVYANKGAYGPEAPDLATLAGEGVLVAVSSGNDSTTNGVEYPAADPNAVAVGASDQNNEIADFSSDGPNSLDLLAPGVDVVSTGINSYGAPYINPLDTGTSFSAPFVAATAALLKQANPRLTEPEELQIMQDTGFSITDTDESVYSRINIGAALASAVSSSVVAAPAGTPLVSGVDAFPSSNALKPPLNSLFSDTPILG